MPSHMKPKNPIPINIGCQGNSSPAYTSGKTDSTKATQHKMLRVLMPPESDIFLLVAVKKCLVSSSFPKRPRKYRILPLDNLLEWGSERTSLFCTLRDCNFENELFEARPALHVHG